MRRNVSPTPVIRSVDLIREFLLRPVANLLATTGVQYSAVATVGTTAVEIFTKLIDPGVDVALMELEVALTQRFDNLIASSVGSLAYYWRARTNLGGTINAWVDLMATQAKGVPTSGVAGDPAEDTFSGYIPVASLPDAPFDLSLMAVALVASSFAADVKNSSYVRLVGATIPGT